MRKVVRVSYKTDSIFVRTEVLCDIKLGPEIHNFIFQVGWYVVIREGISNSEYCLSGLEVGSESFDWPLLHSKQIGDSSRLQ